jgi:signal transduction histidine kinase
VRLTARTRLTALYTAVFAAGGGVLVAVTYALVRQSLSNATQLPAAASKQATQASDALAMCARLKLAGQPVPGNLAAKCAAAYQLGVQTGVQAQSDAVLHDLLLISIATLGVVLVLAAFGGWLLAGRVLRPVQEITAAARAAGGEDLTRRVGLRGPRDELRELADTFDAMLDRLQAAFTAQGRFIANASHELRTPLATLRTTVDVVLAKPDPSRQELIRMAEEVRTAVDEAGALLDALLVLARNERGLTRRDLVDLADLASTATAEVDADSLDVELDGGSAVVAGDPVLLQRLVVNLVDNATRYNLPGGHVRIRVGVEGPDAVLVVANSGPIVPADRVADLFEPFDRLEQRTGTGLGLGLTLVRSIAELHGGSATASASPTGGLVVEVRLPADSSASPEVAGGEDGRRVGANPHAMAIGTGTTAVAERAGGCLPSTG